MAAEYSVEVCRALEEKFRLARLYRPMRVGRYDAGTELVYDVRGIEKANTGRVHLVVEEFVGGGFAGQVYRVKVLEIEFSGAVSATGQSYSSKGWGTLAEINPPRRKDQIWC